MAKSFIIVPTYNERSNIGILLEKIFFLNLPDLWVLVVDDNSPDGTGRLVEELKSKYQNLEILHRSSKAGLGAAYLAGFEQALKQGADYIFEMDADLSHNPEYLPNFLQAIQGADLVLGSRYIKNGGVVNWNLIRRFISRFGNIYARFILGLPYHDLTGGFKCYRRLVLEKIGLTNFSSVGYNFQIETTYKTHLAGFKIVEIPIMFTERAEGKSKFSLKIILESFWKVLVLKFRGGK
ncbi:MAG: polyprenol monophosphomannose synthase [Patescibacteria group bacterium]|jgi:dolichol-phosphate mannosyltransferase|nr:polyprenol monophosphomannose synthase [Patescibacteria group bacterium]